MGKRQIKKEENRSMLLVLSAFLGCGMLHVGLYDVPYTTEIVRIVCGMMALIWAHSTRERILNLRVQRLMTGVGLTFLLLFLLQVCNFHVFYQEDIVRTIEYAYYVPIILIPLLVFKVALYLNIQEDEKISPLWHWLWLPAGALIILFLTNDLHHFVFSFPGETARTDYSRHMLGYWVFVIWAAALLIAALCVFIHKCRLPIDGVHLLQPLLPVGLGVALLVSMLFTKLKLFGVTIWNMGEIYAFMGIGFLELCIQNGLIPSNQHYQRVFSLLDIPARIESTQGRTVYSTAGAGSTYAADEDHQLHTAPISGGSVSWLVDLSNLHQLDRDLQATVEQLESRNSILQMESAIREEKEQHDTQNRIYSHIAQAVRPQLDAVERLLNAHPEADPATLSHIAVRNAYIKRRGNLELLAEDMPQTGSRELMLAIRESLMYVELCGVETYADCSREYSILFEPTIEAYAGFEQLLEMMLDNLLAMAVYVFVDSGEVRLRFNCRVKQAYDDDACFAALPCLQEFHQEINDLTITLGFQLGGDAVC